jgi:hypothetical protein
MRRISTVFVEFKNRIGSLLEVIGNFVPIDIQADT